MSKKKFKTTPVFKKLRRGGGAGNIIYRRMLTHRCKVVRISKATFAITIVITDSGKKSSIDIKSLSERLLGKNIFTQSQNITDYNDSLPRIKKMVPLEVERSGRYHLN